MAQAARLCSSSSACPSKANNYETLKIFTGSETAFIAAQWRHKTRALNITDKFTAKRLVRDLLSLRKCENRELKDWFIEADKKLGLSILKSQMRRKR